MDELLEQFIIEGRDLIGRAEAELDRLSAGTDDAEAVDGLFRAVHTLKGSFQIFNLVPGERLLHGAEDRLMAARQSGGSIDPQLRTALVACIDQTDRWIDEMERAGRLGDDALAIGDRLLEGFASEAAVTGNLGRAEPDLAWLPRLKAAAADAIEHLEGPLVAFRYAPDADAFFRGDDPLAIVAAVPGLEYLAITPTTEWPSLNEWDPFRCCAIVEGVSAAPTDAIRAAFKLVPDQVQFSTIIIGGAAAAGETTSSTVRTMRVDAERIQRLADEVGELVVAANGLAHVARMAERAEPELASALRSVQADVDRISGALHRAVAAIRLVPLAPTLRKLPRVVREIAGATGKSVQFEMRGETIEVDKQIADNLFEPLLHIVRNAIDHGLEDAGGRAAAGKPAEGRIVLTASRQGDEVVLAVTDDGGGIDPGLIREVAVQRGVVDSAAASELSDAQALRLVLMPGFSTAKVITDLSGRGVGMDAVKTAIDRLRGRISIDSEPKVGTTIEIRLPLDAITTRLLVVRTGNERYGVPLDQIVETARLEARDIRSVGRGRACVLRGRTVPMLDLADMLGVEATQSPIARLLVTESAGEPVAVRVDGFDQRIDAIMRENDGLLQGVPGMAGSAVLSDGSVLLVLDLPELVA